MIPSCPEYGQPLEPGHSHDNSAATFYNPDPDDSENNDENT